MDMPVISKIDCPSVIHDITLRKRAEKGHCSRSQEFVALLNGQEVGLLSYEDWSENQLGFIYEIFVLPPFRRQGIGEALLSHAESYAQQLGCKSVELKPHPLDQKPDKKQLISWYMKASYRASVEIAEHLEKFLLVPDTP